MDGAINHYKLSDLKKGMRVNVSELSSIYNTWIILYKPSNSDIKEDGIIGYIKLSR